MKKKPNNLFFASKFHTAGTHCDRAVLAVALSAMAISSSQAASLSWIGSGGTWDLATSKWSNAGSPVAWSQTSTTSPLNDAVFAGADGTYAVTIGTGQQMAANFLTFNNSGYTVSGGTLYLLTGGNTTVATGKTATINSAIATANNSALNLTVNSGGTLNLGGGSSLIQGRFLGAGALNLTAGTYSLSSTQFNNALTNQTGGTLNMTGSSTAGQWLGYNAGRSVNFTISGGYMNLNGGSAGAYLGIGRSQGANSSTLTIKDSGTVNIGTTAGNSGQINIVSNDGNGSGLLDVQGGTLTVGTGQSSNQIYLFNSGASASKTSTFQQSGGTVTTQGIQFGGGGGTYSATALAKLELTGGNLYVGSLGITKGSAAASLPVSILLNGGTLGASADWSSSLSMTVGGAVIRAADAVGTARNITLSGALTSSTGFSKTGGGVLSLSGGNNISGAIGINAGTLAVESGNALVGVGNITFGGGTLRFSASNTTDYASRIVNSASAVSVDTNGQDVTFATGLAGTNTAGLTKQGPGKLTLNAANSYTGTTTVTGGTLLIGSGGVIGNNSAGIVVSGATSALSIGSGGSVSASGVMNVSGGGAIYLEPGGTFNVTAASFVSFRPDATGSTATSGKLASSGAVGTGGTMTVSASYLRPSGVNNGNHTFTFDNVNVSATNSTLEVGRGGSGNITTLSNGAVVNVENAVVSIDANNYTLNVESGSTLSLQNNTFQLRAGGGANNTTVNINGGTVSGVSTFSFNGATSSTVSITNGGILAATSVVADNGSSGTNTLSFDNGKLTARANGTLLSGSGTVSLKNGGATIDSGIYNATVSAALTEDGSSTGGGLTKIGSGTLILTGGNSYSGNTTVSNGTLLINGNVSASALTTVNLGTFLGGSGTIGSAIINGTLAPGNSPGTLTFTDTLGLNGSTVMEIDGMAGAGVAGGHDFVNLTGAGDAGILTYGGALTLDIGTTFSNGNYSWDLFDMASETGTFATIALADKYLGSLLDTDLDGIWNLASGNDTWQFNESIGSLSLTVVPEPNVAALLGGLGAILLLRRRRL